LYTNALYGFAKMIFKLLADEQPTHMLVAFDAGRAVFRHQEYALYKEGRMKTPSELSEQIPYIHQLLEVLGICHYQLDQYEADDIIGTLVARTTCPKLIISGDRDLLQLLNKETAMLYISRKGLSQAKKYTALSFEEEYSLKPAQLIDLKGLMGDKSDNIPGVPLVGPKTASKLLHKFGTLEAVLANFKQVEGVKLQERLRDFKEQALLSKRLATICLTAPLKIDLKDLAVKSFLPASVNKFLRSFELTSLLVSETTAAAIKEPVEKEKISAPPSIEAFQKFLQAPVLALSFTEPEPPNIMVSDGKTDFFINSACTTYWPMLKQWLLDQHTEKIVFNLKELVKRLISLRVELEGPYVDLLLAAYLLQPGEQTPTLTELSSRYLEPNDSRSQICSIFELNQPLQQQLAAFKLTSLLEDLEIKTACILANMELMGIKIDQEKLTELGQELKEKLAQLTKEIFELAEQEFNINSPKQLSFILFEKLGLKPIKKTKTGFSTNADVLQKLAHQHEIVAKLLHFRQVSKLVSTYIEGLQKEIKEDGKIHTQFNQTITTTGRLSSSKPNLQNIPIRLPEGRLLRKVFIPHDPSWLLLTADYSQIELRVLAHLAQDPGLLQAFADNEDIHTQTARKVFNISEVSKERRRHAKAVNFGIVYGMSDFGLAENLNISRKEAGQLIKEYFLKYPNVRTYMDQTIEQAKEFGYVTTIYHRRRYLEEINSRDYNKRSFAERAAINMPVQGSAADIIKMAMVKVYDKMKRKGLQSRLLLQVHDELVFEMPPFEKEQLIHIVQTEMEEACPLLTVPLVVDIKTGQSWYAAK
ncbi:MAG: polymerase, partial [Bacillota bacterium]